MTQVSVQRDAANVCEKIMADCIDGKRMIVAIAGPPASGKSTLAEAVVAQLNAQTDGIAALLPMDGYHLDNRILEQRGLLPRKGAPETFDAHGFCEAVTQLRSSTRVRYFPSFDRALDLAVANTTAIGPDTQIIVVEGNYLLLDQSPWRDLRKVFDLTIFVAPPVGVLRARLQQRWIDHGLSSEAARLRASGNDIPNAELVLANSLPADIRLEQGADAAAILG